MTRTAAKTILTHYITLITVTAVVGKREGGENRSPVKSEYASRRRDGPCIISNVNLEIN